MFEPDKKIDKGPDRDNRRKMAPIPNNYKKLLSPAQLIALNNVGKFGWELHFVRRNGLEVPVPVVKGPNGETIGVIDEDGNIDTKPKIVIRD